MEQLNLKSHRLKLLVILSGVLFLQVACLRHSKKDFAIKQEQLTNQEINVRESSFYKHTKFFHEDVVDGDLREVQLWLIYSDSLPDKEKKEFLNSLSDGTTVICKAIEEGNEPILRGLSKHSVIDINKTGKNITSLLLALKYQNSNKAKAMALILLNRPASKGLNVSASDPITGNTALHTAARRGYRDVVDLLLGRSGIDLNKKNKFGKTALELARSKGHIDVVALLEKHLDLSLIKQANTKKK